MPGIIFAPQPIVDTIEGRKTLTRRLVKPTPYMKRYVKQTWGDKEPTPEQWAWMAGNSAQVGIGQGQWDICPYGAPGTTLWARELWLPYWRGASETGIYYPATHSLRSIVPLPRVAGSPANAGRFFAESKRETLEWLKTNKVPFRSPIFMPRWASRLTLRSTAVRIERLQDISEEDARREVTLHPRTVTMDETSYRRAFAVRWAELHGDASWALNPWVWVISYEVVEILT